MIEHDPNIHPPTPHPPYHHLLMLGDVHTNSSGNLGTYIEKVSNGLTSGLLVSVMVTNNFCFSNVAGVITDAPLTK